MKDGFKCPLCGNDDSKKIGYLNGKPYCRACISFRGAKASPPERKIKPCNIFLDYGLSKEQQDISDQVVSNYISGKSSLVHAVTGRPKTRNT